MRALVIGGGVSGLTTALVLQEAGWQVTVIAREWAPRIVSSVAAAIWYPYQVAHPRATHWALVSAARFGALLDRPECGVRAVEGVQLHRTVCPPPDWAEQMPGYRALEPEELPEGYACGYSYELPIIETPIYLRWLRDEVERRGATFEERELANLDEVMGEWPVVVNCTGLAAREFVGDATMVPIRGQIVKMTPGYVDRFLFDEDDHDAPTYIIPRQDATIVGGTAIHGDWDLDVRADTTTALLGRARQLAPELDEAQVLDVLVGLRPGRPTVRLDAEQHGDTLVIHNYGHGGGGFTLSWGCAEEVLALIEEPGENT
jgi:D-amino-acid oxidase